ncbi:hypothetical protein [Chondromyces crocatus]|uniref:PARP-type domain-containing protein n=1 Tax=Chondromyces crocatus TaxID=52 RepID=A0A0K1EI62_CHOCO|nr:hypothetical protein [Chondromyces crocatus]AKT40273.1 uncharacterized protein CMC5_044260 [Chondromyces crocatus]
MGFVIDHLDTDVGGVPVDLPKSDGKAVAELVIAADLDQFAWVRASGAWFLPIGQLMIWQPARRALRSFAALSAWLGKQKFDDDLGRLHLAYDVPPVALALKEAVAKGATEVRVTQDQTDVIERAKSGRSRCRVCGKAIEAGTLRFGEDVPSFSGLGWHHLACGATKGRGFLRALRKVTEEIPDRAELERVAREALKSEPQPALERAPTGRAKCVVCAQLIPKGSLRASANEHASEANGPRRVFADLACAPLLLEGSDGRSGSALVAALREHTAEAANVAWDEVETAFQRVEKEPPVV